MATQLHIIATSEEGTRAALREARQLKRRLKVARTVLLVPCAPAQAIATTDERVDTVENYRQMASETGVEVTVRMCFGSTCSELARWMIPPGSTTVVGGRRRWWWPTRAQRMADALKRAGHQIVFADASGPDHASV